MAKKRKGLQLVDIIRFRNAGPDNTTQESYQIKFRINGVMATTQTSHHIHHTADVTGRVLHKSALEDELNDILGEIGFLKPTRTKAIRRYCR